LAEATTSFPQTAPNVDDVFEPVTWHHQRHPFIRALTCKTGKTCRGVAGRASSDDQVKRRERERERERERGRVFNPPLIILIPPFYTHVCHMPILLLSSSRHHVDVF
jgi:hypothetical protein